MHFEWRLSISAVGDAPFQFRVGKDGREEERTEGEGTPVTHAPNPITPSLSPLLRENDIFAWITTPLLSRLQEHLLIFLAEK